MVCWAAVSIMTKRLTRYETGQPSLHAGEANVRPPSSKRLCQQG
jgi:hypothetical protein